MIMTLVGLWREGRILQLNDNSKSYNWSYVHIRVGMPTPQDGRATQSTTCTKGIFASLSSKAR